MFNYEWGECAVGCTKRIYGNFYRCSLYIRIAEGSFISRTLGIGTVGQSTDIISMKIDKACTS